MAEGTITRKDIITDDALNWGPDYAKGMEAAIGKNKEFVTGILAMHDANNKLRRSENQTDFIKQKNDLKLITDQTILSLKEQHVAETNLEKIKKTNLVTLKEEEKLKQEKLKTEKQVVTNQQQQERSQKALNKESTENVRISKLQNIANLALAGSYEKIQSQLSLNTIKWKKLSEAERANTTEGKALTKEILNQETALKKLDAQLGKSQRNVGNYGSAFSSITGSAGALLGAFGIVGGVSAIAAITTDIVEQTKELQSLDLALQTVTGTQKEFESQQQFLRKIAMDYGADLNTLTKSFVQFYASAKDKISGNEIQSIFESVTKAGGVLGLSVERQEKAFLALNQMMSKNTIQAEELKGQLSEALPNSMGIMTKAVQALHPELQVTEKMLGEMMKAGELMSAEVLPEFARQMEIAYGIENVRKVETLTAKTNRMSNEWTDFIRTLNESPTGGFFGSFFGTMMDMGTDFLKLLKDIVSTQAQIDKGIVLSAQQRGKEVFDKEAKQQNASPQDKLDLALNASKGAAAEIKKLNKELRLAEAQAEKTIVKFGDGYEALLERVTDVKEKIGFQSGVNTAAKARITQLTTPKKANSVDTGTETDAQRKSRLEKEAKDALDAAKRLSDALYQLEKQRLERAIKDSEEIKSNDKLTDDVRIQAAYASQVQQEDLINLTKKKSLDADKFVLAENRLNANEKLFISRDAANKIVDIEKKTSDEIAKINEFDLQKYKDNLEKEVTTTEIAMNKDLATENERFAALGDLEAMAQKDREKAIEDHERNVFNIKLAYARAIAKLQADNLETELNAFKAQSDGSEKSNKTILDIEKRLSDARLKLTELGLDNFKAKETEKVVTAKEKAEQTLEVAMDLTGALADLSNAFSEAKIEKIDQEIDKNNEYYDKQIELAGNDERQKDLLQKERDKKNEELEKKKRAAQHKQAVFDKALNVSMIAMSTALAVIKAWTEGDPYTKVARSIAAGVVGAIQLAATLATPIPKYKLGRKGGPAEMAWVGDGGVSEVIERKSGRIELTPNIPTLTHLGQGDIVHSSVDSYDKSIRASILYGFEADHRKISEFQAIQFENNNKELVDEMRLTRKAIEKNKTNITVNVPKVDIPHEMWKAKNKNWNP